MANLHDAYDNTGGELQRDLEPIVGWHKAAVVETERKAPNDKGNSSLMVKFKVMEGKFEGRECSKFLQLWNSSAEATSIANRELNSICNATGILRSSLQDSDMLIGRPIMVLFGPQKDKPQYSEPKGYKALNAMPAGQQHSSGTSQGSQPGQTGGAPWKRSA